MHSRKRPVWDIKMPIRCAGGRELNDGIAFSLAAPTGELVVESIRG
jgi:hypothetical protein